MKKFLVLAMTLFACIFFVPFVLADIDATKFGKVTDASKSDSVKLTSGYYSINDSDPSNVLVEYGKDKPVTLQKLAERKENDNVERPDNKAWFGITVAKPTSPDLSSKTGKYNKYTFETKTSVPVDPKDSDYYFPVDEEAIKSAIDNNKDYIEYKYEFDWNEDNTYEQTITIKIYVAELTLQSKSGDTVWTPTNTAEYKEEVAKNKQANDTTKKDENLDNMPKTGDTFPIAFVSTIILTLALGAYNLKLAYSRK